MDAGRLDRRIAIERATYSVNAMGEQIPTWSTLAEVWAEKKELRGTELYQAMEVQAEQPCIFRVRWLDGDVPVLPTDRVLFEGRVWNITAATEIGRREGWEISARCRAETATP